MKLYLDSNVLISYLRSEMDRAFNLRFQESERFLIACRALSIELIISELFLAEVERKIGVGKAAVKELFESLGIKAEFADHPKNAAVREIMGKTGIHFADAMHVANALASGCGLIVTWNKKDFRKAMGRIPCATPAEFTEGL